MTIFRIQQNVGYSHSHKLGEVTDVQWDRKCLLMMLSLKNSVLVLVLQLQLA